MDRKRGRDPRKVAARRFPQQVVVADVALPSLTKGEFVLLEQKTRAHGLPTAVYVRQDLSEVAVRRNGDDPEGRPVEKPVPQRALGRAIKTLRESHDQQLTPHEVAGRAGVALEILRSIEAGEYDPHFDTVWQIARGLGVTLRELVDLEELLAREESEESR